MRRKVLSLILAASIAASMLAGCGAATNGSSSGASADSVAVGGEEGGKVSIYVYGNDQEQALYQKLFDQFEQEYNCEVDAQFDIKDDYGTTITGMMTANSLPDVFYMGPENVSQYVENGYVLDMKPILEAQGLATDDILQDILGMYEYNDGLYGLPHDSSVFAYAYNKDLFDEAGLEYPNPDKPYTYEEFVEVCQKLTKDTDGDGEIDQWGCGFANAFMFYQFVWGNGASFCSDDFKTVTVDSPEFIEALEKYADLTLKYGVTPTVEQDAALGVYNRWLDGQEAFYACGTWDVAAFMDKETFAYDWDLCAYPTLGSGKSATWCGTVGYCVNANTENPDLATKLAYYMSASKTSMELLSGLTTGESVQIPNLVSMAENEFATAVETGVLAYPDNYNVLFNYLNGEGDYTVNFMESTFTPNAEWLDIFFEGLDNVKNGSETAADYCRRIEPEMQSALDDAWSSVE